MKLRKRKVKHAAIFFVCWFAFLVFLVDGVLKFQTLVDYFGSYMLVEISLILLVILPTLAVYFFTKDSYLCRHVPQKEEKQSVQAGQ